MATPIPFMAVRMEQDRPVPISNFTTTLSSGLDVLTNSAEKGTVLYIDWSGFMGGKYRTPLI